MTFQILGTGSALPLRAVSNEAFIQEHEIESSDEWIRTRTGIEQRHVVGEDETTATLAAHAAQQALMNTGVAPEEVDGVIVATCTPDVTFPAVATMVQQALGIRVGGMAIDVNAACGGFIYALQLAQGWIATGAAQTILVIGAENFSKMLDYTDRSTAVLFGDGAGAVVLQPSDDEEIGLLGISTGADGTHGPDLYADGGVATTQDAGYVKMNGREVFKHAVRRMGAGELLKDMEVNVEDIDWLIPHQANVRILEASAKALGIPMEKVVVTVNQHANTSAASIP